MYMYIYICIQSYTHTSIFMRSTPGSFHCECEAGFYPQRGSMKSSNPLYCEADIDECSVGACRDVSNSTCVK